MAYEWKQSKKGFPDYLVQAIDEHDSACAVQFGTLRPSKADLLTYAHIREARAWSEAQYNVLVEIRDCLKLMIKRDKQSELLA